MGIMSPENALQGLPFGNGELRTPCAEAKRVAHGQFPDVAAKLTAWQVRSYEYAEDRYTSSRVLLRSIRSTCPIAETGGGYDAAQSS